MNIAQAKEEIKNTVRIYTRKNEDGSYKIAPVHQRPVLLIGPPGIGKTAIMEQVAKECEIGLVAYTITHHTRQSAVGLPLIKNEVFGGKEYAVTEYTMSEIIASVYQCIEKQGYKEGILFIDEINCVSETLAPTMLQFLQCKIFGTHKIPDGWVIVAAGNPPQYNKSVREFDIVTLDRVKWIEVKEDYSVWRNYALKNKVHPSIIAYLDLKTEQFYKIEATADGYAFVTARGWEDLSRILWMYEESELEITVEFLFEYLQHEEVARGFLGFYQLCKRMKEEYGLMQILEGTIGEEKLEKEILKLKETEFDARVAILTFLSDGIHQKIESYDKKEQKVQIQYQEAKTLLEQLENKKETDSFSELLERKIEQEKHAFLVKKEQGLLTKEEKWEKEQKREWLEELKNAWKQSGTKSGTEQELIRACFNQKREIQKQEKEKMQEILERAFDFAGRAFGDGQESAMFVERLSMDERILKFIQKNGCSAYQKAGACIQAEEREEELQNEIQKLTNFLQK